MDKIHDPDSLVRVRRDERSYNEFFEDVDEWLQQQNSLADIKKEPEMKAVLDKESLG